MIFFFCLFSFLFLGVIRGRRPLIVLFCHSQNLLLGIHAFAFFFGLKYCGPLIEPFRGDDKRMIEAFRNDGYGDDRAFRSDDLLIRHA